MLLRQVSSLLLFVFAVQSIYAQTFSGPEAHRLLSGSELIKMEEGSSIPLFVKLNESAQFPSNQFTVWAKKAFKLGDGMEVKLVRHEEDKESTKEIESVVFLFASFFEPRLWLPLTTTINVNKSAIENRLSNL